MSEQMNVPKLRFGKFESEWSEVAINSLGSIVTGSTPPTSDPSNYMGNKLFISPADLNGRKYIGSTKTTLSQKGFDTGRLLPKGSVCFVCIGSTIGKVAINSEDAISNQQINTVVVNPKKYSSDFVYARLVKDSLKIKLLAGEQALPIINKSAFGKVKVFSPTLPEQQKIASFLSKVDEKIGLLSEKKDKLTEYKRGVMQRLFNGKWHEQDGQLSFVPPTLRFKADDDSEFPDWEEKKLGEVFTRIRNKNKENNQNVLTISAQHGLINQQKYFNKSVSAKDVTGYYLLESGNFAYNKSYSKGYPMGAIKRLNNYDKGVVSTLYICFRLNNGFVSDFFEHYFESGLQNRDLSKIAQEGARNHGLLNISVNEFFKDVKLLTPIKDEQSKIANFISAIDQKIDLANSELNKAKEWKKGLLQQMFV